MAIIIGDIHGNVSKVKAFLSYKPEALHVALGDYVDGPGEQEKDVEVLQLLLVSRCVLLWGNHELCYLLKNPFLMAGYSKYYWPEITMKCPITKIIEDNKTRFLAAYAVDGWLCTHAGANDIFIKKDTVEAQADLYNRIVAEVVTRNNRRLIIQTDLFQIGSGGCFVGGIFMLRAGEEKGPGDKFRQIFGHQTHKEPWRCKGSFRANEFIALATYDDSCWIFDTKTDELVNLWQS